MSSAPNPAHENRLAREASPYLLQHKHNPVDWWPWGPEALAEAQRSGRPILLSIGYAACHWCHVMAHESFEDEATAAVMNALFVNIKVDREERPDIDQIYMAALQHIGKQGGWPLTMFLTPDGKPVWGGTYFPKDSRYGRPAFTAVLREVARMFREEPDRIAANSASLMTRLAEVARPEGQVTIGLPELDDVARRISGIIDPANGGMRGAPKFPQAAVFELLWRAGLRERLPSSSPGRPAGPRPGDPDPDGTSPTNRDGRDKPGHDGPAAKASTNRYFAGVELTLEHICEGGIYDHLGGGFSRYSVDERWLVPHFEKMLYDNAQLLGLLALGWGRTGNPLYRQRTRETVAWLGREMTRSEGAFSASLDADSEGEEGKFYVWALDEVRQALDEHDAAFFADRYDVTAEGNFDGHNILNRLNDLPRNIRRSKEDEDRLAPLREKLLAARAARIRPDLDDKVLADWNGLMIAALAEAGIAMDEPDWIAMARRAFTFIAVTMTRGDRLGHSWRDGRLVYPGLASDFAAMTKAALALHEVTGEAAYLDYALTWQRALERHHDNPEIGGYFLTADDAEGLVMRPNATWDDATPNHNAVIAANLARLAALTGDEAWRARADRLFDGLLPAAAANVMAHTALLNALDVRLRLAEIVVTGTGARTDALLAAALKLPPVTRAVLRAPTADALRAGHPARDKIAAAPDGAAFVCVGQTCSLPVTEPDRLAAALSSPAG